MINDSVNVYINNLMSSSDVHMKQRDIYSYKKCIDDMNIRWKRNSFKESGRISCSFQREYPFTHLVVDFFRYMKDKSRNRSRVTNGYIRKCKNNYFIFLLLCYLQGVQGIWLGKFYKIFLLCFILVV